jgi:hypothetical protein
VAVDVEFPGHREPCPLLHELDPALHDLRGQLVALVRVEHPGPSKVLARLQGRLDPNLSGQQLLAGLGHGAVVGMVNLGELNQGIEDVLVDLRKNAGWGHIVKSVEDYRDDLMSKLEKNTTAWKPTNPDNGPQRQVKDSGADKLMSGSESLQVGPVRET